METLKIWFKSATIPFFLVGVPTQINTILDLFTALDRSVVKDNLPAL